MATAPAAAAGAHRADCCPSTFQNSTKLTEFSTGIVCRVSKFGDIAAGLSCGVTQFTGCVLSLLGAAGHFNETAFRVLMALPNPFLMVEIGWANLFPISDALGRYAADKPLGLSSDIAERPAYAGA